MKLLTKTLPLAALLSCSLLPLSASAGSASLKVFAPKQNDIAGVESRGFVVDLRARLEGDFTSTGAALELTGPGPLANAGPLAGDFSIGHDPSFPGLVVLLSARGPNAPFGPEANLANLFNIVAVTDRSEDETELWATWIIGAKNIFGSVGAQVNSELLVAIVDGQAPDRVDDVNGDGRLDKKDLQQMGYEIISNVRRVNFTVNGL
ncbi:MAG: hypothetical protein V7752_06545 [Halopseudomonas sp.]